LPGYHPARRSWDGDEFLARAFDYDKISAI